MTRKFVDGPTLAKDDGLADRIAGLAKSARSILGKLELWRLLTNFLFFGTFSLDFLFHMYFL